MARWLIEGTWRGYRFSQDHVCHREVTNLPKFAAAIAKQYGIAFTDGTMLILSCREVRKGERVKDLKDGYGSLIRDCYHAGIWSVQGLCDKRKTDKEARENAL